MPRAKLLNVCDGAHLLHSQRSMPSLDSKDRRRERGERRGGGEKMGIVKPKGLRFVFLGDRLIGQQNCWFELYKTAANQPFVGPQFFF